MFLFYLAFACLVFSALLALFPCRSRQPKLFFISSTTSTTILTTSTFCYVTSTTTAMATCKKRRAIKSLSNVDSMTDIQPMRSSSSDAKKEEEGAKREGRWLNYWITTTITTMTTFLTIF